MKKYLTLIVAICLIAVRSNGQVEPGAGNWKPWLITDVKTYRITSPANTPDEIKQVIAHQHNLDSAARAQIFYWNAGAPGYRWHDMMNKLWMNDTSNKAALSNLLLGTAIYDATIAAWDIKFANNRARPFAMDSRIVAHIPKPESPSFPCEYSVAAGVAATIISHFYPAMKDSVHKLAQQVLRSRISAGVAFPSDTRAGFELGEKVAMEQIELTKNYIPNLAFNGKMPDGPAIWKGKNPIYPLAGKNKTFVLDSASQFRPAAPPDFTKEMAELKNFKPTFRSQSNAFFYASQPFWEDQLNKKMFEYNLHLNPPQAARIYAAMVVATYDGFIACFDAKYAYWGTRPDQMDTTYRPPLLITPPFPGYPSGHAMMSGMFSELYSYFFPAEQNYFKRKAKDAAESRFQAGIHFRSDNEAGLELGRKVANKVLEKIRKDGASNALHIDAPGAGGERKTAKL